MKRAWISLLLYVTLNVIVKVITASECDLEPSLKRSLEAQVQNEIDFGFVA